MSPLVWLRNLCSKGKPKKGDELILNLPEQIKAWQKANRKMGWNIPQEEFNEQEKSTVFAYDGLPGGFIGTALFYGFGDDGSGNSDAVLLPYGSRKAEQYHHKRACTEIC